MNFLVMVFDILVTIFLGVRGKLPIVVVRLVQFYLKFFLINDSTR